MKSEASDSTICTCYTSRTPHAHSKMLLVYVNELTIAVWIIFCVDFWTHVDAVLCEVLIWVISISKRWYSMFHIKWCWFVDIGICIYVYVCVFLPLQKSIFGHLSIPVDPNCFDLYAHPIIAYKNEHTNTIITNTQPPKYTIEIHRDTYNMWKQINIHIQYKKKRIKKTLICTRFHHSALKDWSKINLVRLSSWNIIASDSTFNTVSRSHSIFSWNHYCFFVRNSFVYTYI